MDRIARIRELEGTAEHSATRSDADRWEAARLIWEEMQTGKSQRQIAEEIGKSGTHVMWASRTWELWGAGADAKPSLRPAWKEAYESPEVRQPHGPSGRRRLRLTTRQMELHNMPYQQYLATEEWQERKREALDRAGHMCQVCGRQNQLQVHHKTYDRRGHEDPDDLTVLCEACHALFHGKLPTEPGAEPATSTERGSRAVAAVETAVGGLAHADLFLLSADDMQTLRAAVASLRAVMARARAARSARGRRSAA